MGKTFLRLRIVLMSDTSWRSDDSTSVRQLGPDFRRVSDRLHNLRACMHETWEHPPELVRNTSRSHRVKSDTGALLVVSTSIVRERARLFERSYGAFTSLGIMGKTFLRRGEVLVNDTSWRSYDSTSVRQLGPDFVKSFPVGDVGFTTITYFTFFTIDWRCNCLLVSTLLSFKHCVLVNQL